MAYHHALSTHSSHTCQQLFMEAFHSYSAWLYSLGKGTCSGWRYWEIRASGSSLQPVAYGGQLINSSDSISTHIGCNRSAALLYSRSSGL